MTSANRISVAAIVVPIGRLRAQRLADDPGALLDGEAHSAKLGAE
jgi:hypothetical protein